ncbi:hypothetical protein MTO96_010986 [Rhipicephalus appendiculatus]
MEGTETTRKQKALAWMKKHLQLSLSIVGIILGLIVGYSVAAAEPNEDITTLHLGARGNTAEDVQDAHAAARLLLRYCSSDAC